MDKAKGILKVVKISAQMANFMKKTEASRPEMSKAIWAYVKEKNLQLPTDKRTFKIDETLKPIFPNHEQIGMFEIAKQLSAHVIKEEQPKK